VVIGTDCIGSCKSNKKPCDHDHGGLTISTKWVYQEFSYLG